MKYSLIILAVLATCFSCKSKKQISQKSNPIVDTIYLDNLETHEEMIVIVTKNESPEGEWFLQNINGISNEEVSRISLNMNVEAKDKKVGGNDGCNLYSGQIVTFDKKNIAFGPLASTKRACIVPAKYAQPFYTAMQKVKSYNSTAEYLVFKDADGKQILQFLKKEAED